MGDIAYVGASHLRGGNTSGAPHRQAFNVSLCEGPARTSVSKTNACRFIEQPSSLMLARVAHQQTCELLEGRCVDRRIAGDSRERHALGEPLSRPIKLIDFELGRGQTCQRPRYPSGDAAASVQRQRLVVVSQRRSRLTAIASGIPSTAGHERLHCVVGKLVDDVVALEEPPFRVLGIPPVDTELAEFCE